MSARRGTVLIVIAGLAALLASLAVAFLARMRGDGEESVALAREAQARIMLSSALMYVAETSRLGWQAPGASEPIEAFGWVDIRDGRPGPRDQLGRRLFVGDDATGVGAAWPAVGGTARCPLHVLERPPFAVSPRMAANPMPLEPDRPWAELVSFANPDPAPIGADWADFARGDRRIRPETAGRAWFRAYRRAPAEFVFACGAGATLGFRDWDEVMAAGATDAFGDDREAFAELRRGETILWYAAEWHPSVASPVGYLADWDDESIQPIVFDKPFVGGTTNVNPRDFVGSFLWIERLLAEPPQW